MTQYDPRDGELNKKVFFNVSFQQPLRYQPIDLMSCEERTFIVLGRFQKAGSGTNLNYEIEFFIHNYLPKMTDPPTKIFHKVTELSDCYRQDTETVVLELKVEKTDEYHTSIQIDPFLVTGITFKKGDIIDLKLLNSNGSKFKCSPDSSVGDHICTSIVVEE